MTSLVMRTFITTLGTLNMTSWSHHTRSVSVSEFLTNCGVELLATELGGGGRTLKSVGTNGLGDGRWNDASGVALFHAARVLLLRLLARYL